MQVKLWGVRGSLPSSLEPAAWSIHFEGLMQQFFDQGFKTKEQISIFLQSQSKQLVGGFGTATSCVEVTAAGKAIVVDGGSGIRTLSDHLMKLKPAQMPNEFHILMTHYHFDHILGLPFFIPHFMKGKKVHYYIVQDEGEEIIRSMFKRPIFPVGFEHLEAEIIFHRLQPRATQVINGFQVRAFEMDHPDPCFGFRIEHGGKVYAHAVDNEGIRTTKAQLGEDGELYENANLVFFDAQYAEEDMIQKKGWGHGTCDRGFEVASHFGVQQILFGHHDPAYSIQDIWVQKKKAELTYEKTYKHLHLNWDFAVEGQVVEL